MGARGGDPAAGPPLDLLFPSLHVGGAPKSGLKKDGKKGTGLLKGELCISASTAKEAFQLDLCNKAFYAAPVKAHRARALKCVSVPATESKAASEAVRMDLSVHYKHYINIAWKTDNTSQMPRHLPPCAGEAFPLPFLPARGCCSTPALGLSDMVPSPPPAPSRHRG